MQANDTNHSHAYPDEAAASLGMSQSFFLSRRSWHELKLQAKGKRQMSDYNIE